MQIPAGSSDAPNLKRLLGDPDVLKLFHFGRFDLAVLSHRLGVMPGPVYCTKIASKLVRTYTDRHGLKDLDHASCWASTSPSSSSPRIGARRR